MHQFNFENNLNTNNQIIKCPIKIGHLCWFIHSYKVTLDKQLIKGLDLWCGYYCGSICTDFEKMKFQHAIMLSDKTIEYANLLFETKKLAQNYMMNLNNLISS